MIYLTDAERDHARVTLAWIVRRFPRGLPAAVIAAIHEAARSGSARDGVKELEGWLSDDDGSEEVSP